LFLSVFGLPVSGSFGSFSQMMVPQSAPPQSATRMRELPPWVSHTPAGSAASAGPAPASPINATAARKCRLMSMLLRVLPPVALLHTFLGGEKARQEARPIRAPPRRARGVDRGYRRPNPHG
jgi:hypothetical protein